MSTSKKQVVDRLKERASLSKKSNVTFRLSTEISEKFKLACKKDGYGSGMVIEELMLDYIETVGKGRKQ